MEFLESGDFDLIKITIIHKILFTIAVICDPHVAIMDRRFG